MDEMIRQGAVNGSEKNIGKVAETIAVDEENRDLDSTIDKLRRSLRISKTVCVVLGVVIVVVIIARLLV